MIDDEIQRVRAIQSSMEDGARPGFDDYDMENLRVIIRVTVEFYDYLQSTPPWPHHPDDPFNNMTYMLDKILWDSEFFVRLVNSYGCLVGSRKKSTIDWNTLQLESLRDRFLSMYDEFVRETEFDKKCRLLLDLYKLQIVFAGAFYDCHP